MKMKQDIFNAILVPKMLEPALKKHLCVDSIFDEIIRLTFLYSSFYMESYINHVTKFQKLPPNNTPVQGTEWRSETIHMDRSNNINLVIVMNTKDFTRPWMRDSLSGIFRSWLRRWNRIPVNKPWHFVIINPSMDLFNILIMFVRDC